MGIFDRLNRVIRSNINATLDRAEDPAKMIEQTILEMEEELRKAKADLVAQLGTAKRLESKAAEAEAEAFKWEEKAMLALRAGDENLARDALKMKHKVKANAESLKRQAEIAASAAAKLQDSIANAERKLEDFKARKSTIAAQLRGNRTAEASALSGGISAIDRLTSRIDRLEAEIEASAVLEDPERETLEARFKELEKKAGGAIVEDELAALKKRLEGG